MTNTELETLIMSTNFQSDIERNFFLMEMAEHDQKLQDQIDSEYKKPDWWNIAIGWECAEEAVYTEAVKIFREFLRFEPTTPYKSTKERIEAFSLAKITNKTGVEK